MMLGLETTSKKRYIQNILLIFIVFFSFSVLSPCLFNDFINWDDEEHIISNPDVQQLSLKGIQSIFSSTVNDVYIPLTVLSFSLEYKFVGADPFFYHLNNLLLHLANTVLVFLITKFLLKDFTAALLASLIFGIHPMHVESVAWATERKDVLYSFFYLWAMVFYWRFLLTQNRGFYIAGIIGGVLSMLAKPMALSLPLILLLLDWYRDGKIQKRHLVNKIPFFLAVGFLTWITYQHHMRLPHEFNLQSAYLLLWTSAFYISKFIYPVFLTPLYPVKEFFTLADKEIMLSFFTWGLIAVYIKKTSLKKLAVFAVLFYFFSAFFLFRYDTIADKTLVADRFMYLPSFGFCVLLAKHIVDFIRNCSHKSFVFKAAAYCAVAVLFGILSLRTYRQSAVWQNSLFFWNYVISYNSKVPYAFNNRGIAYMRQRRYDEALNDFNKALDLDPNFWRSLSNRGNVFTMRKHYELALADYNSAINAKPDSPQLYNNRGLIYQKMNNHDDALADFSKAIEIDRRYWKAYYNRGILLSIKGQYEEAIEDFSSTVLLNPQHGSSYFYRSVAFFRKGDKEKAMADLKTTFRMGYKVEQAYADQVLK